VSSTDFLYPFIEGDERDADALLADLAASAREKARESARLRAETLARSAAELAATAAASPSSPQAASPSSPQKEGRPA